MHMLRNMMTSLIKHERIHTTYPKAKALGRVADRMVTMAREDSHHNRNKAYGFVREKEMVWKLFDIIGPMYKHRPGGFTRVIRSKRRVGDGAPMAYIEFVDRQGELRPAKTCDEQTTAIRAERWEEVKKYYAEKRTEHKERMANWKTTTVPSPYREIDEFKDL